MSPRLSLDSLVLKLSSDSKFVESSSELIGHLNILRKFLNNGFLPDEQIQFIKNFNSSLVDDNGIFKIKEYLNAVNALAQNELQNTTFWKISHKSNLLKIKSFIDKLLSSVDILEQEHAYIHAYVQATEYLVQGPRIKSYATYQLESVMREFLNDTVTSCRYNILGELEISGTGTTYNLTEILRHKPDFEQLSFTNDELEKYAIFFTNGKNGTFNSEKEYANQDPEGIHSNLHYAEKLAITAYTCGLYKPMQEFLRNNGTTKKLLESSASSLVNELKLLVLTIGISSHGLTNIQNLPSPTSSHLTLVSRTETGNVLENEKRKSAIQSKEAIITAGYTSTTSDIKPIAIQHDADTLINIVQAGSYTMAKDISRLSYFQSQSECLFVPGTQFKPIKYEQNQHTQYAHQFTVVPVRTISGIDPFTYSQTVKDSHQLYVQEKSSEIIEMAIRNNEVDLLDDLCKKNKINVDENHIFLAAKINNMDALNVLLKKYASTNDDIQRVISQIGMIAVKDPSCKGFFIKLNQIAMENNWNINLNQCPNVTDRQSLSIAMFAIKENRLDVLGELKNCNINLEQEAAALYGFACHEKNEEIKSYLKLNYHLNISPDAKSENAALDHSTIPRVTRS